jgi:hypothetical protein
VKVVEFRSILLRRTDSPYALCLRCNIHLFCRHVRRNICITLSVTLHGGCFIYSAFGAVARNPPVRVVTLHII